MTRLQWLANIGALLPFLIMVWDYSQNNLTINPIQEATSRTGKTALVLLVLSLACTPLNTLFGWRQVLKLRRTLGLYAFYYASMHFLIFIGLDYGLNWNLILEATFEKRYALVGFSALMTLLPLAITSSKGWQKRLKKNWKKLHKLSYVAGILVVVHFVWLVKSDYREPLVYGGIVAGLLLLRVPSIRKRMSRLKFGKATEDKAVQQESAA
ncbi:MAG: sulfoxide reductase heme-binding subunit YedZ [Anaerolineae bacterium]|nr:sulfoxide reductase heme-binding subunit YedZ [Anaerolineae bacterium]